jgi:siderophore synthetase component
VTAVAPPAPGDLATRLSAELVTRVLDSFLREDVRGLRSRSRYVPTGPDGEPWLRYRTGHAELLLPVRRGGFLADLTVRGPVVLRRGPHGDAVLSDLDEILDALTPAGDPEAEEGFADFRGECRQALAETALLAEHRTGVLGRLGAASRAGMAGNLRYEALAAHADHPVYPTSRCRLGLRPPDLLRYAPEYAPEFRLTWVAVPRPVLRGAGRLPSAWPSCGEVGLPALDGTHLAVPVHPLTDPATVAGAIPAPWPHLRVSPTLSMRTVALCDDPTVHLKLPLPTSTLGRRNVRTLAPGSLVDGAAVQDVLTWVLAQEPELARRVLLADEGTYVHAGHPLLGVLVRRYPAGLGTARVVPLAALAAPGVDGRCVVAELADESWGGDVEALLEAVFAVLLDWTITLWLRYGIALEAHQQNVAVVLAGRTVRLLLKDNDGARIDPAVLGRPVDVDDGRMLVRDPVELADVVTTITLHLCVAAVVDRVAAAGLASRSRLLGLTRRRLVALLGAHAGARDADLARTRLLDATRLPVKTMVTAGTLLPKGRTGALDINKHYGATAPNYLR